MPPWVGGGAWANFVRTTEREKGVPGNINLECRSKVGAME